MTVRAKEIKRFNAQSDDGEIYEVIEFQNIIAADIINTKSRSYAGGTKFWELSDGDGVEQIDPKTFKISLSKKIIRKID